LGYPIDVLIDLKVRWRAFDVKAHKKGEVQIAADKACITMRMQSISRK